MARVNWQSPLGAGISLFNDCSTNMKSSSGIERVYEAINGRLRDKLFYNDDYGIQVAKRLRTTNPATWESLSGEIESELLKDDRLSVVEVTIDYDAPNRIVTVHINGIVTTGERFNLVGSANTLTSDNLQFQI